MGAPGGTESGGSDGALAPISPDVDDGRATRAAVVDADQYRSSIRGVTIDTVRTGYGEGPNEIESRLGDGVASNAVTFGYPVASRSVAPRGTIVMAVFDPVPGARWVGVDLEPGLVMAYGPEAEHAAVNPMGLSVRFAVVDEDALARCSHAMQQPLDIPKPGEVRTAYSSPSAHRFSTAVDNALGSPSDGARTRTDLELASVAASILAREPGATAARSSRGIDSRYVTARCIEYAESVGRIPAIVELCEAAHVSERRLRTAFAELYDMPPTLFFRIWALAKADRRLRSTEHHPGTVTRVALDLGISHLGRFSARYRELYGVSPSQALAIED